MITKQTVKNNQGFTLVEMMISISILLIAVVGPMSVIGNALHKIYYAKDEITAINLAQEGIEIVRQIRDSNMLDGGSWKQNMNPGEYVVDARALAVGDSPSNFLISCSGACNVNEKAIVYDGTSQLYRQGIAGTATHFSRVITIGGGGDELLVTSRVDWTTGNDNGSITLSEYVFKWVP